MDNILAESVRRTIREKNGLDDYYYEWMWNGNKRLNILMSVGFSMEDAKVSLNCGMCGVYYRGEPYIRNENTNVLQVTYNNKEYDVVIYSGGILYKRLLANVNGQLTYLLVSGSDDYNEINRLLESRKKIITQIGAD